MSCVRMDLHGNGVSFEKKRKKSKDNYGLGKEKWQMVPQEMKMCIDKGHFNMK